MHKVKKKLEPKRAIALALAALTVLSLVAGAFADDVENVQPEGTEIEQDNAINQETPDKEMKNKEATETEAIDVETPFTFSTVNYEGEEYTEEMFDGYEVIVVLHWEPWSSASLYNLLCMQELADNYGDRVLCIGVCNEEYCESIPDVIEDLRLTIPMLVWPDDFDRFDSAFVPTAVLLDSDGKVLSPTREEMRKLNANVIQEIVDCYNDGYYAEYVGNEEYAETLAYYKELAENPDKFDEAVEDMLATYYDPYPNVFIYGWVYEELEEIVLSRMPG